MKTIKAKLIHILGGYTKEEYNNKEKYNIDKSINEISEQSYNNGYKVGAQYVIAAIYDKAKNIYGVDKQEWINIMWKYIHFLYYRNIDSSVGNPYK